MVSLVDSREVLRGKVPLLVILGYLECAARITATWIYEPLVHFKEDMGIKRNTAFWVENV